MPTTLVSGGAGYVGRFIVNVLLERGYDVVVMGRRAPPPGLFVAPVKFVEGSLDPDRDQSAAFAGVDNFVHAAFDHLPGRYRGGEGDDPAGFRRRNVDGSMVLFEQARMASVRRAVFLSSRAVYGTQPPGTPLDEAMRPHPDTLYGEVKLAVERRLHAMAGEGFAPCSLRVTGVYGLAGRDSPEDKWTPLLRDWLAGKPVEPRAGSEVHGEDVGMAVATVLDAPADAVSGQVFNVSDLMVDRCDLLVMVQQATGCPNPLPPASDTSRFNVMTTEKIASLGWKPGGARRLRDTVRDLVDRLQAGAAVR